jgi:hypothetical protein
MSEVETPSAATPRFAVLAALAAATFLLSAMLRQYREITIPVTIVLALWAGYAYFSSKPRA